VRSQEGVGSGEDNRDYEDRKSSKEGRQSE